MAQQQVGDLDAGFAARLEGERVAERIGSPGWLRWFKGVLVDHRYRLGEWDEALRAADEFIAEIEAGSPHYGSFQVYAVRAEMRSARGDSAGAIRDAERALAAGRALDDPQALLFVLAGCAHLFVLESVNDRAVALARELLDALEPRRPVAVRRHQPPRVRVRLSSRSSRPRSSLVRSPASSRPRGWTQCAPMLRAISRPPPRSCTERARGRRKLKPAFGPRSNSSPRAAPAEADQQLQQALAFYRSVNATRFVRECEALLTASPAGEPST